MVFAGALKGAGDTQFIMRVSLVLATTLAVLSWLGVEVWNFGIYGCWALITTWVWAAAIAYVVRYRGGKWRTMRVIESSPAGGEEPIALMEVTESTNAAREGGLV
jgi:MATE family multidrug resistance protein